MGENDSAANHAAQADTTQDDCHGKGSLAGVSRRRGKPLDMRSLNRTLSWRAEMAKLHRSRAEQVRPGPRMSSCPICQSTESSLLVTVFGFDYDECSRCQHVYLATPPTAEEVRKLYEADDSTQSRVYLQDRQVFQRRVDTIARPKVAFLTEQTSSRGLWLDVGSGAGELLVAAEQAGFETLGLEPDPRLRQHARALGLQVSAEYCDPPKLAEDNYGVVSALNVVEHQLDPAAWLCSLTHRMTHGCWVLLEVPRHPSLSSLSCVLHPHMASRHIYPPDHLHIFSEGSMAHLLRAAGLGARALWTFGQDFQELLYTSTAAAGATESPIFHTVLSATARVQQALDDCDLSDTLLVAAQKESP